MMRKLRNPIAKTVGSIALAALPITLWASHSWNGFHWARTRNPFTLKLGNNAPLDMYDTTVMLKPREQWPPGLIDPFDEVYPK
jgi:hypothetical protein